MCLCQVNVFNKKCFSLCNQNEKLRRVKLNNCIPCAEGMQKYVQVVYFQLSAALLSHEVIRLLGEGGFALLYVTEAFTTLIAVLATKTDQFLAFPASC